MIQIVKHIVSRLTEVYDRRAFRRAEILGCFLFPSAVAWIPSSVCESDEVAGDKDQQ